MYRVIDSVGHTMKDFTFMQDATAYWASLPDGCEVIEVCDDCGRELNEEGECPQWCFGG